MHNPDHPGAAALPLLRQHPAAVKDAQSRLLRETLALARRSHPAYRERWSGLGIDPNLVTDVDSLSTLPVTRKSEFMAAPESFRLDPSALLDLPIEKRLLWEVMYTTGTSSGSPSALYMTSHDHYSGLYASRMVADFHGITERDLVANLYPLTSMPMGAFIRATDLALAVGASAMTPFPGKPYTEFCVHRRVDQTISLVARRRATVLVGVATFIRHFVMRAQELGADLSSVRRVLLGGEAASMQIRIDIEDRLHTMGADEVWVTSRYGSTEMGTLPECTTGSGWHNPAPDLLYLEVVDEHGNPLPEGEVGDLAATHLNKTGTVLIRYLIGDRTSISYQPCPHCGRSGGRIVQQPHRASDLVKVRGMLINPSIVHEVIASMSDVEDHQIVITKSNPTDPLSMDDLTIRVIPREPLGERQFTEITRRVQDAIGITPAIETCHAEDIFDPHSRTKPLRFVDQRRETNGATSASCSKVVNP